jgi:electron transfer flavoprotein beta subunit
VRIVVLAKPVPDTTRNERPGPDVRLDRASAPTIIDPNDEHAVEQALRLIEAHGGEITLLTMAPPHATAKVLAAALATLEFDLVLVGIDTPDDGSGVVAAAIATIRGLPYLSYASSVGIVDGRVRVERLGPWGHDVIEAPLPALVAVTQVVGDPRYALLKGIMGARSKEIATVGLDELGLHGAALGGAATTTRVLRTRAPAARGATRVFRSSATEGRHGVVGFLAERRLI